MSDTLTSVAICAAVGLVAPAIIKPLLRRARVLDVPNARSSHTAPVLRGGGLAPLVAIVAGAIPIVAFQPPSFLVAIGWGVLAAGLGLIDDLVGLSAKLRLTVQLLLGLLLGAALILMLDAAPWVAVLGALFYVAYMNMTNFMDGIDGISALHGAIAGAICAIAGWLTGNAWLVGVSLLIAGAFLTFLPWNVLGSKFFLGDVGSYLLGGSLAAVAACAIAAGVIWPAVIAPLSIYVAETSWAVVRRIRRRESWWEAHRQHYYQRLVDAGISHGKVAVYVSAFTLLAGVSGLMSLLPATWSVAASVGLVIAICAGYFSVAEGVLRSLQRSRS